MTRSADSAVVKFNYASCACKTEDFSGEIYLIAGGADAGTNEQYKI